MRQIFFLLIFVFYSCLRKFVIRLFDTNLREVDNGISKIVALFNERFPDGKTAFVVSSDHGMSNKGMHVFQLN